MRLGPGFSFSWRRAIGISGRKSRISRRIGVPLTESGREFNLSDDENEFYYVHCDGYDRRTNEGYFLH